MLRGLQSRSGLRAVVGAAAVLLLAAGEARAEPPGWREVWAGADVGPQVWLAYSGVTVAPYGHLFADGLRLRAAGGYGGYSYSGERRGAWTSFRAETAFGEMLVGYLQRVGPLTAKGFVGIAAIEHDIAPEDPENPAQGMELGPKLVIELWLNLSAAAWSSLDLGWTSAHDTAAGRIRTGYRVFEDLSLGLEGAVNANSFGEAARAGLFARYAWDAGEVSVSAGFSGRFLEQSNSLESAYTTLNWLGQF